MRGTDLQLVRHSKFVENFDAGLHKRQIGLGAEDDADDWLH
jgi:hypothetical protein